MGSTGLWVLVFGTELMLLLVAELDILRALLFCNWLLVNGVFHDV